jgi:CRISPR-associated endonuclease Cas1
MAASQTVSHLLQSCNSLAPKHGVITLFGHGITVNVDRGHLILKDGIGPNRFEARLPRVGHGLRRLVVVGSDGFVSLAALRWLADQDASFVMLERNGSVLATTGPARSSDARLRRAQALTVGNGTALEISKELIRKKLIAQERLLAERIPSPVAEQAIAEARERITKATSIDAIRVLEAQAAYAYWSGWRNLAVNFPTKDLKRVPEHWRSFGTRISPLTGSPRLSVNPPNAMLNYLYAVLESECRLAAAALGLDPGLGFMHVDSRQRDSLPCDLMEPIRPQIDAYVFDCISRAPLSRDWFFEQRDGNCRLMSSLCVRLSETAQTWGALVAPIAEWLVRILWETLPKPKRTVRPSPATPLTQSHRREGRGLALLPLVLSAPKPLTVCKECGAPLVKGKQFCSSCGFAFARTELIQAAQRGRIAAQSPEAQARRTQMQRQNAVAQAAWKRSAREIPITEEVYRLEIQPQLSSLTVSTLMDAIKVCKSYAGDIRAGRRRPHPRHWRKLATLVGQT